ncbi:MAG: cytochrome c-type biogenesis protein CcmH [Gammaproteobacteria bacterium]|nr:cytochrome c-type biogenesis protein CcmH [Gammaproteobacteria bacterium]
MKRIILAMFLIGLAVPGHAIDEGQAFADPEMQARYEGIISEVRCLVCQNQTIKDSNVFLAADLRREIRRLLSEGKSNADISEFLVSRYGDFVLYRPPMRGKTLILWLAPFLLIGFGIVVVIRVLRGRMSMSIDDDNEPAST